MIVEQAASYDIESTVKGRRIEMGISREAYVSIMDSLTNLYSDPQMAVLREYSTNARDAHIEAGVTRPIEVTLPNDLAPFLKIRDYGVGLNEEDIATIYSQYGISTKRDSNDFNGTLGYGCKSGLAYSSQFSVVSIKDHKRTTVNVARDEDGFASMTVVSVIDTTEGNGTTIIIPADAGNQFQEKARTLFSYWPEGSVLVNSVPPKRIEGLEIIGECRNFNMFLRDKPRIVSIEKLLIVEGHGDDIVVMGGVPYPVQYPFNIDHSIRDKYHLVAFVGIGDVLFAPSREALRNEALTRLTLKVIADAFKEHVSAVQKQIDALENPREAFRVTSMWRDAVTATKDYKLTYRGEEIPYTFEAPLVDGTIFEGTGDDRKLVHAKVPSKWLVSQRDSGKLSQVSRERFIYAGTAMNGLFLYGDIPGNFTAAHKKKLVKYIEQQGIDARTFIMHDQKVESKWIDPTRIVEWKVIAAIKLPKSYTGGYRGPASGTYDLWLPGDRYKLGYPASDIDTSAPIIYINTTDYKNVHHLVRRYRKDATIVELTGNRINKFCRDFPSAIDHRTVLREVFRDLKRKITKKSYIIALMTKADRHLNLRRMDPQRIDDPELRQRILVAQGKVKVSKKVLARIKEVEDLSNYVGERLFPGVKLTHIEEKYPLLDIRSYGETHEHNYHYINCIYKLKQEGKL